MDESGPANRNSWKILPFPANLIELNFEFSLSRQQFTAMKKGNIPQEMEDKWFLYYEDGHLYFHRSWTGIPVYDILVKETPEGAVINKAFFSEESKTMDNIESEIDFIKDYLQSWLGY
jgi:hypothetical protein